MNSHSAEEHGSVKDRAKTKLIRDMGPLIVAALQDPKTREIMLNPDGQLWQEVHGEKMKVIGKMDPTKAEAIVRTIAGYHGKEVTKHKPILECELPLDGSRFAGQLPPIVSAPTFAIRKKAIAIFTLNQYVESGIMSATQYQAIKDAITERKNILVTGGTGSGKTTLVNAVIHEMVLLNPDQRIFIIEDTGEIQCAAKNSVTYHTTIDVSMTALLKTTLRMRPCRILVGEVRGPEALDLLMAWNTGHPGGAATLHANNAKSGLDRLAMLISMHPDSPTPIQPLIGEAVDVVVHIARTNESREVEEIIEVTGYENGKFLTQSIA